LSRNILHTGVKECFDQAGKRISCTQSPQDGFFRSGKEWPQPRFALLDQFSVQDRLTNLVWSRKVNFFDFPLTWSEALEAVKGLNREKFGGCCDWRLPNRRELRSVVSHADKKPALPAGHPFEEVFLGWYWTSTTAEIFPANAWYVHLEGGRMFYGNKAQRYLAWPLRGFSSHVPATGQTSCFDALGRQIPCKDTGQDGENRFGQAWPQPRFIKNDCLVHDLLTGLVWQNPAKFNKGPVNWSLALETAYSSNNSRIWRLPSINELESLVDASAHSPALPEQHPFTGLADGYWSSTTSAFETDWAYVLYLNKGAVGVGFKSKTEFYVWPVSDPESDIPWKQGPGSSTQTRS